MLYEAYESDEAAATHKNTVHYIKWRDTVKDFMVEPRKGVKYNIIEPNDKENGKTVSIRQVAKDHFRKWKAG